MIANKITFHPEPLLVKIRVKGTGFNLLPETTTKQNKQIKYTKYMKKVFKTITDLRQQRSMILER